MSILLIVPALGFVGSFLENKTTHLFSQWDSYGTAYMYSGQFQMR